ncbi:MAG: DEAD/DEAH box helicase [Caulobacteraceae bacterium]|nr:DEAD/DEAH box helicase [Caulobacteraceae bacterium]
MPFPTTHPALARALADRGYLEPTPVQAAVLEGDAPGRDLLVSAQTGSGKTVAFGLAMAQDLLGEAARVDRGGAPRALVVAPTRELAMQVARELGWLYAPSGARIVTCVGGMDSRAEQRNLEAGCHIVVGTPGRLRDHLERSRLNLAELKVVVLDEADEMLDLGFREDLEFILDAAPAERRTLLFSATIARDIARLARTYQRDALRLDTVNHEESHGDIEYRAMRVAPNEIQHAVVNVLRYFEAPGALVFCSTRESVRRLHMSLRERGFDVVSLSGEMTQRERSDALQALRDGKARVCVATDVAARGLDLPDLGLVLHAELPVNKAGLLHRSGRTGRAGRKGVSIVLVPYTRRRKAETLFVDANVVPAWSGPPTAEEVRVKDNERLLADALSDTGDGEAEDEALVAALLAQRTPEQLASAVVRARRARLPSPEEVYDDARLKAAQETPLKPRREFVPASDASWFRLNVGRGKNADPKWLVPLICRLGHVTKSDIGVIRIFDRETKFEISKAAAGKFAEVVRGVAEGDVRIEPTSPPSLQDRPRRDFKPRPRTDGDRKPWEAAPPKSRGDAPRPEKAKRGKPPTPAAEGRPKWQGKPNPEGKWIAKPKWAGKPKAEAAARAKWEAANKPAAPKKAFASKKKKANG